MELCATFRGRYDVLEKMESFFYGNSSISNKRKTFAICGLGGSGKTQMALRFMFKNMHKYRTGVMYLNARNTASLNADFQKYQDMLKLEGSDSVSAVKHWLSKEENSEWLMIFDNADDLSSVSLPKYFPSTSRSHIIITSRDQAALNDIAEGGCILDCLDSDNAMDALLARCGIEQPTEMTHGVPRRLSKSLEAYRLLKKMRYLDLYAKYRSDLLRLAPRVGNSDRTVLTAWEVNFQELEKQDSKHGLDLLLLFAFLEPSKIPEDLLRRGCAPQRRWGENGELIQVSAEAEGVNPELVKTHQQRPGLRRCNCATAFLLIDILPKRKRFQNFLHPPLSPVLRRPATMFLGSQ
ncbi:hypothetical protein PRK78_007488 [Emydomyces testavorans]|uniref:NB-ARC domain-containing protein n=1 Tax=Emydomyces testavorans TaxID=2070801 RepID=A0AAF0DPD2_9EURO|nr:hypothetical protein PRK78_007488 [Emydomyces testavorans]